LRYGREGVGEWKTQGLRCSPPCLN
jgi:hypothetical protein